MRTSPAALVALAALTAGCGTAASSAEPPAPAERAGAASDAAALPAPADQRTTLVIGSVSDDPAEEAEVFQPFVDHVAGLLAGEGVTGGDVVVAETPEEMAEHLRAGRVDLFVDNMHGTTTVVEAGAAVPLLRRWKDGSPEYYSVVVARAGSGLATLADLPGSVVAFEDDTSTDGYLLPAATLVRSGLRLAELEDPADAVPADEVGYVFTGDDENTVFAVLEGRVDAGALSEEDLEENAGAHLDELVVLGRTVDVPRHGVVARTGLDPALTAALTGALTSLHESAQGREVLEAFDETARFDPLAPESLAQVLELFSALDDGAA